MATKKAAAQALIERVSILRREGFTEDAEALREEAEAAVAACAPRDRKALGEELEAAFELEPAAPTKELVIRSWRDVDDVEGIVNAGVRQVRKAVDAGLKTADMARQIAVTLLDARLKMPNDDTHLPDIIAQRKYTKDIARDLFKEARKGVTEEDVHRWDTHESLAKAVRNRMSDVMVDFLRGLEEDPDKAKAVFPMLEFPEGVSATEVVYDAYASQGVNLPRKGRTELAREDAARKRELVQRAIAGELPPGDDEDVDEEEELARDMAALDRVEKNFISTTRRAERLTPDARAALKAKINQTIVNLSAAAAQL
ncbi:hypothetical protein [Streptomyces cylindrosporus]|uniref:Uncharacterized protein n=1 Tax=Streptomyces cylindrosporus TaxID=2927583 RepID=A0ABS9Y1G1_9ACTN|nr:hypothetical protein [Streptomyces cylindrosporus]MCI3271035.1 hypothetical protein [Streptomyces cylindrosporus]